MKYVYTVAGIIVVLFGMVAFTYSKGYKAGSNAVKSELLQSSQEQTMAIVQANKKIIDFQKSISNNNDECFNRVWDDEIIKLVNPILR